MKHQMGELCHREVDLLGHYGSDVFFCPPTTLDWEDDTCDSTAVITARSLVQQLDDQFAVTLREQRTPGGVKQAAMTLKSKFPFLLEEHFTIAEILKENFPAMLLDADYLEDTLPATSRLILEKATQLAHKAKEAHIIVEGVLTSSDALLGWIRFSVLPNCRFVQTLATASNRKRSRSGSIVSNQELFFSSLVAELSSAAGVVLTTISSVVGLSTTLTSEIEEVSHCCDVSSVFAFLSCNATPGGGSSDVVLHRLELLKNLPEADLHQIVAASVKFNVGVASVEKIVDALEHLCSVFHQLLNAVELYALVPLRTVLEGLIHSEKGNGSRPEVGRKPTEREMLVVPAYVAPSSSIRVFSTAPTERSAAQRERAVVDLLARELFAASPNRGIWDGALK